jgi:NADH-quinone oxidoreductase subunit G
VQSLNKFQEEVGGQLRGGDPGIRLIEPHPQTKAAWFEDIPAHRQPEDLQWLFVPLHHIFGSEELSVLSPGIAKLCPKPYVALHPEDALALGMAEGDVARVALGDLILELCVKIVPSLPRKVAGLPVGLPGAPVLDLPASGMVLKGESDG